jgi:hypothetical protein
MERREFLKLLIAGSAGSLLSRSFGQNLSGLQSQSRVLPSPQVNTYSSEIVLNSRRSYHSGYSGALSDQILANILWAAAKAPVIGANRIIYVARPDNVYQYDPQIHDIILHVSGNHMSEANCAFEVGIASDLAEDAGATLHYANIAAYAFWLTTSDQPICCPKESATTNANSSWNPGMTVQLVNCYGHMPTVSGITSQLVAISSNGSLPDPSTDGPVILENALANLPYGDQFSNYDLSLSEISQLAWASYGNTPHLVIGTRAAIAVASAVANYYLTGRIYIVRPEGVERYHIRLPSGQVTTRDHRIERVTDGDRRSQLRAAIARLPQNAPIYFVYCGTATDRWQILEAGFSAAGALLQSASLDLQGYCTADFTSSERTAIINALGIPSADLPLEIFSVGQPLVGKTESNIDNLYNLTISPNPFKNSTNISYRLVATVHVKLAIYDGSGRLVRMLVNRTQPRGNYKVSWNSSDEYNNAVPEGIYHLVIKIGAGQYEDKLVKMK